MLSFRVRAEPLEEIRVEVFADEERDEAGDDEARYRAEHGLECRLVGEKRRAGRVKNEIRKNDKRYLRKERKPDHALHFLAAELFIHDVGEEERDGENEDGARREKGRESEIEGDRFRREDRARDTERDVESK